jgi:hypothetical protein
MKKLFTPKIGATLVICTTALLSACDDHSASQAVSFSQDIKPILSEHCLECHQAGGAGALASGLVLDSYQGLIKGTKFGPVIKAGDSLSSTLVILIEGRADTSINMPHGDRPPVSKPQVQQLRQWIDEGTLDN